MCFDCDEKQVEREMRAMQLEGMKTLTPKKRKYKKLKDQEQDNKDKKDES